MISDGGDNNSRCSAKELFEYAMEANVQIYGLGVRANPYGSCLFGVMADDPGGLSITVDKLKALVDAMNTIGGRCTIST